MWRPLAVLVVAAATVSAGDALDRATKGQWVHYKMANDMTMKQSIVKVEGKKVTIKNDMWIKGQALPANETTVDTEKKPDPADKATKAETAKSEDGELEINGHKLKCKILTQGVVKTWVCDDVPITGIVRQELNGKPTMELTGYGNAPDEDRLKKS